MPANPAVGDDDDLLKVYARRLTVADGKYEKGKVDRLRFVARYRNETESDQVTEEGHVVSVTSGIGVIDTMFASMTAVNIEFIARNIGHGSELQGLAATAALNQAWRDAKANRRTKDAIKDSILVDIGWVKVYYDRKEEKLLKDIPEEALRAQIADLRESYNVADDESLPREAHDELEAVQTVTVTLRDRVCLEYVPWDMIRADPTAKRIEDVRWVAQYSHLPVYEVHNHPEWSDYVTEKYGDTRGRALIESVKGDTTIEGYNDASYFTDVQGNDDYRDGERVTICEMWDFETGLVTVFPKNRHDIILHQSINPLMMNVDFEDRSPFKPLIIRKDNSTLEGLGDMRIIKPALDELDEYRNNLATHISRSIPKIIGPEEGLTSRGKDALKSQVWGEFIGTEGRSGQEFTPLMPPPIPQEALQVPDRIQVEIKDAVGVSEPMRGVFPSKRTTATETQIVTDRGDLRQSERRDALVEWYESIGRCMLQLMQTYYDKDRMLRYTSDTGEQFEWAWNAEDIAQEADILVSITPKANESRDNRVQQFLLLMNLALPIPEADRAEFVRQAAVEMGYRQDEINKLIKTPEEVQAEQQQQQLQQLATQPQPGAPGLGITPIRSNGGGAPGR